MRIARFTGIAMLLLVPIVLSGCSLLGLGGPLPLCADPAVKLYVQKANDINSSTLQAANRMGELLSRLQNDPSLIDNSTWKSAVDDQVQKIVTDNQKVQNLRLPRKELGVFHQLLIGAFQNYADGVQTIEEGLNEKDTSKILSGVDTLSLSDNKLKGARDELSSILGDCPWFSSNLSLGLIQKSAPATRLRLRL